MTNPESMQKFIVRLAKPKNELEGNTTISLPKKLVIPLKNRGINVGETITGFLKEIIEELDKEKGKGK